MNTTKLIPEAVDVAVLRDADELERPFRLQRGDLNGVTDLESLLVGCAGVDDDLVVARGPATLEEAQRVELGERRVRVDPEPSVGQPLEFTASPSGGEDLRVPLVEDAAGRQGDLVDAAPTSRSEASTGGVGGFSPSMEMSRPLPVTTASVPAYRSTRRSLNARWTVSVRM